MKKIITAVAIVLGISATAQDKKEVLSSRNHEFRWDVSRLLAGHSVDFAYEKITHNSLTFGIGASYGLGSLEKDVYDMSSSMNFTINPYVRYYILENQRKQNRGMFIEGAIVLHSTDYININRIYSESHHYPVKTTIVESTKFDLAMSFALGWKIINSEGFVLDLSTGVARNILHPNLKNAFFKGGVSLGYRF
ncbi:hypothetical protein AB4865_11620 [Capnocytophaga sp. ARDL2]|uniref:hypothetical protein n=1 Tax=Capnocytophaga sp. ARDL2 TaxID=3238809 RepID=UPI003556E389